MKLVVLGMSLALAANGTHADDSAYQRSIGNSFTDLVEAVLHRDQAADEATTIESRITTREIAFSAPKASSKERNELWGGATHRLPVFWQPYDGFCLSEQANTANCPGLLQYGNSDEPWIPFIRGEFASDDDSQLESSIGVGFLYSDQPGANQLGIEFLWAEPNKTNLGSRQNDQYSTGAFYRISVNQQLAITPHIKYISQPVLGLDADSDWSTGIGLELDLYR